MLKNARVSRRERRYVREVLDSEFRSSKATNMVSRVESAFAKFNGNKYAIACTNGTATLHTALEALGVGPGDEVIVPPLTMAATCYAVLQANATPVFADVDLHTWQIDPQSVADKITEKTKAVISVALYGTCPDYYSLKKVIGKIPLIEDNAEAVGVTYDGKIIGGFGDFSSYSFQSSKHLTAGEGGMLCTDSRLLADSARKIQSLGYRGVSSDQGKISKNDIQNPSYMRHEILGWNYRMSDITAAVVLGQIEHAESLISVRKSISLKYAEVIENCDWLQPQRMHDLATHSYWAYPVLLLNEDIEWQDFVNKFREFGGAGIYAAWQLNYNEPVFQNRNFLGREQFISEANLSSYSKGLCPNAEYLQPRILAFRTNEWNAKHGKAQISALRKTIDFFGK